MIKEAIISALKQNNINFDDCTIVLKTQNEYADVKVPKGAFAFVYQTYFENGGNQFLQGDCNRNSIDESDCIRNSYTDQTQQVKTFTCTNILFMFSTDFVFSGTGKNPLMHYYLLIPNTK